LQNQEDQFFNLVDVIPESTENRIELGEAFALQCSYEGLNDEPAVNPGLVMIIISPPPRYIPASLLVEKEGCVLFGRVLTCTVNYPSYMEEY
jgi:hypothetical protein